MQIPEDRLNLAAATLASKDHHPWSSLDADDREWYRDAVRRVAAELFGKDPQQASDGHAPRVDDAAEARRIIHEATHDENGPVPFDLLEDRELAEHHASMAEAQARAALALAEQQRIANLIDFASLTQPIGRPDLIPMIEKELGL